MTGCFGGFPARRLVLLPLKATFFVRSFFFLLDGVFFGAAGMVLRRRTEGVKRDGIPVLIVLCAAPFGCFLVPGGANAPMFFADFVLCDTLVCALAPSRIQGSGREGSPLTANAGWRNAGRVCV